MKKWKEDPEIIKQMIDGSKGILWGNRLEQSGHYPLLKHCLDVIGHEGLLIDLGCGAGDVSRVWRGDYLGVDLEWVIEKVAKSCNSAKYLSANLLESIPALPDSKCVLMNAFLDTQEDPLDLLQKVIDAVHTDWIVIHRQKIGLYDKFVHHSSYGGSTIPISTMSIDSLEKVAKRSKTFEVCPWEGEYHTIIMRMR